MNGSVLFGFDLFGIALALWKMLVAEAFPELGERWKRVILALLMTVCTVLVGLQGMGVLFPPESAPVVTLVLTAITAFLITMGYAPEVIGVVNALVDLIRVAAIAKFGNPDLVSRTIRYRLHKS